VSVTVWYIDGSPYARIIRATLVEFGVEHRAVELEGYPPAGVAELSPAWQVPVIEDGGRRLFGSSLIREYLHETYGTGRNGYPARLTRPEHRWRDAQVLTAIQTLTDSLVHAFHSRWAGIGPVGENRLGAVPAEREMARAVSLLDWLEDEAGEDGFWPTDPAGGGFAPADMALAAAILWTEAREEIPWRGRPRLERIVARLDARDSFRRTAPRPWPGSPKAESAQRP